MIGAILQTVLELAVVVLLQWRPLQKTDPVTRWMSYAIFLVSSILWVYLTTTTHVPRPAMMLEHLLEPFSPVQ